MSNENSKWQKKLSNTEQWFNFYVDQTRKPLSIESEKENICYKCPCCSYKTLSEMRRFRRFAKFVFAEDDGQDELDVDTIQ